MTFPVMLGCMTHRYSKIPAFSNTCSKTLFPPMVLESNNPSLEVTVWPDPSRFSHTTFVPFFTFISFSEKAKPFIVVFRLVSSGAGAGVRVTVGRGVGVTVGADVAVTVGVGDGGTGVAEGGTGADVGGTRVAVGGRGVASAGTKVAVGGDGGTGVAVGGGGVIVGVGSVVVVGVVVGVGRVEVSASSFSELCDPTFEESCAAGSLIESRSDSGESEDPQPVMRIVIKAGTISRVDLLSIRVRSVCRSLSNSFMRPVQG